MDIEELAKIVDNIVRSPAIKKYNIGITLNSLARRSSYRGVGFDHYIVLDLQLSAKAALRKERELFHRLTKNRLSVSYRKYRDDARDGPY